jgi:uncharacterized phage-associated protein
MNPPPRQKARVYPMKPNVSRIIESILFLVAEAQKRHNSLTQYDAVKAIFLADRAHLNKYGRPITYDNYVAMRHGPVPSTAYDFLKENPNALKRYNAPLPWTRREAPELGIKAFSFENPQREPSGDILSQTDFDELSSALTVVKSLGFTQIKKLTHEDRAYIDAWDADSVNQQFAMSYALFFDVPNDEKAAELSFFSQHL